MSEGEVVTIPYDPVQTVQRTKVPEQIIGTLDPKAKQAHVRESTRKSNFEFDVTCLGD